MGETVTDKGKRYSEYSELRLGQINPDIEGSAERWNQGRLRRAGRAFLGLLGNERIEAELDADHTAALKQKIAEGPAHQAAGAQEVAEGQPELPAQVAQEAVLQPSVEVHVKTPQPGGPEQ